MSEMSNGLDQENSSSRGIHTAFPVLLPGVIGLRRPEVHCSFDRNWLVMKSLDKHFQGKSDTYISGNRRYKANGCVAPHRTRDTYLFLLIKL